MRDRTPLTLLILARLATNELRQHRLARLATADQVLVHAPNAEDVRRLHLILERRGEHEVAEGEVFVVRRAGGVEECVQAKEEGEWGDELVL